jgi:CRISPR-associated protein Cas1
MYLFVDTYGAFVAKHQGRLRITKDKTRLDEAPLLHLEQVIISGKGIGISSDAIRACSEAGIPLHFLSNRGTPHSSLYSAGLTGTVLTRRAQLRAYDTERGVVLARAFSSGKLQNQANLLRYAAKYRKESDPDCYTALTTAAAAVVDSLHALAAVQGGLIDAVRDRMMGIEGHYATRYWGALARLVPAELAWPGRETRGATDPLNQALNYGYGVLYKQVEYALVLAGLDPYAGLLHADRPGKPSLVLRTNGTKRAPTGA